MLSFHRCRHRKDMLTTIRYEQDVQQESFGGFENEKQWGKLSLVSRVVR